MMNSWSEFFNVVTALRDVQKEYFKTRSPSSLAVAKELEAQVDDAIKSHAAKIKPVQMELTMEPPYTKSPAMPVFSALKEYGG